jgi:GDP-L-fucose synthase
MNKEAKIYVAGHRGLVGTAIYKKLQNEGYKNIIARTRQELDLTDTKKVHTFFETEQPEYVFIAAAKVGGILANSTYSADFIYENLTIQNNLIKSAHDVKVKKLLFLGSACIYPKFAEQPIKEEYFLNGKLEETNEPYAVAKIAGIILCQAFRQQYGDNFISLMPTNLYGPDDNFNLTTSHVLPALLRKFHEAKISNSKHVEVWGTGNPKREFLHVDDLADACLFLMLHYDKPDIINIGTGSDIKIKDLAELIKKITGFTGEIIFDNTKPDGTPLRRLDVTKLNSTGWHHNIDLESGIKSTYLWFLQHYPTIKAHEERKR